MPIFFVFATLMQSLTIHATDGGIDAGRPEVAEWKAFDGINRFAGEATDIVRVTVGASVDIHLPRFAIQVVCDDPYVRAEALPGGYRLIGVSPGRTHCGFWFDQGQPPARYIDISVLK